MAPGPRRRAQDLAVRLAALLDGQPMPYTQAGKALGVHPNSLRYAAQTGTVLVRWEGAGLPVVWIVPPPRLAPDEARLELARRYLHMYGPATPEAFGAWAGFGPRPGAVTFEALRPSLTPVRTPAGDGWILSRDETAGCGRGRSGVPPAPRYPGPAHRPLVPERVNVRHSCRCGTGWGTQDDGRLRVRRFHLL
jgi:hypothetical protein